TTRYIEPIPDNIPVMETRDQLHELAHENSKGSLDDRNGGYYMLDKKGKVLAVASDDLCEHLDASMKSAKQIHTRDNLEE
ncbi:hypothetical protein BO94DRAFT_426492, partial [Aspergillus sclerotioniger CBS 115572]